MLKSETRFAFGENWQNFLKSVTPSRIKIAEDSLLRALEKDSLAGLRFLDIGSGSGLFSLAARRLGAIVHSFDFDMHSVSCTLNLKALYFPNDVNWTIEQGSVLDKNYLDQLGKFDIVYSWGVLHHTGNMHQAFDNIVSLVKPGGTLFISIYNDQGKQSLRWKWIKKTYNESKMLIRYLLIGYTFIQQQWALTFLRDFLRSGNPFKTWNQYGKDRGMSAYSDLIDWVGGYPFEVAKPEEVFNYFKEKSFKLVGLKTCCGGIGCNEFIFQKDLETIY